MKMKRAVELRFTLARLRQAVASRHHSVDAGPADWSITTSTPKVTVRRSWRTRLRRGASWLLWFVPWADRLWHLLEYLGWMLLSSGGREGVCHAEDRQAEAA